MLVLSRKIGETVHIDGRIKVTIVKLQGNRVKIGIEAPGDVDIIRGELDMWSEMPAAVHPLDVPALTCVAR